MGVFPTPLMCTTKTIRKQLTNSNDNKYILCIICAFYRIYMFLLLFSEIDNIDILHRW